jgi:hypothetical protein
VVDDPGVSPAAAVAALFDALAPIREGLTGYRAQLVSAGFNEAMADAMCVQVHGAMVQKLFEAAE